MTTIRIPEKELRERLAVINPKIAGEIKLHNRGVHRVWTKRLLRAEDRLARLGQRQAYLERKKLKELETKKQL